MQETIDQLLRVALDAATAAGRDVMLQTESEFPWSVYSGKPTVGVGA